MDLRTAHRLLSTSQCCKVWTQRLYLEHNGRRIDVSTAVQGKNSKTPEEANNQPDFYPKDTVYRLDTKYHGIESENDMITMMKHPDTHPGSTWIQRKTDRKVTTVRLCTWTFVCSQHKAVTLDNTSFEDGKLARPNIKQPAMKATKSAGTKTKGIAAFAAKKERDHIAQLDNNKDSNDESESAPMSRRTSSAKTEDPCDMKLIVFLSHTDGYYYLSIESCMKH